MISKYVYDKVVRIELLIDPKLGRISEYLLADFFEFRMGLMHTTNKIRENVLTLNKGVIQ
jgi:hypothetical protein